MKTYKNFTRYTPEDALGGVMYLKDENDNDWYALQAEFASDTMKIAFDSTGLIIDAKKDVTTLVPLNLSVAELETDSLPSGFPGEATSRWEFDGKKVTEKPLTPEEWQAKAEQQRQNLLTAANASTADWRTELQLDVISEEDKVSLIKWMAYIKALKALDLSSVIDEAEYSTVVWPVSP